MSEKRAVRLVIPFSLPGMNEYIGAERRNRHRAAKMKREAQLAVVLALKHQIKRPLKEPVTMHYTWVEKDHRRDKDNISGFGRKVIQDAFVDMKLLRNDGWPNIEGFTDSFQIDKKRPRVEIEIEEAEM